jgi:hypothetical protein
MSDEELSVHPDDLLASYVDGSATPDEGDRAERHLSSCRRCRDEVEAARTGLAALASLPMLDSPDVIETVIEALDRAGAHGWEPLPEEGRRAARLGDFEAVRARRSGWSGWGVRAAAGGVLAATAAAVVALFLMLGGRPTPVTNSALAPRRGAPAPAAPVPAGPALVDRGSRYTPSTLAALGNRLAAQLRRQPLSAAEEAPAAPSPAASADFRQQTERSPATAAHAIACLERGGAPFATPRYLEVATFEGKPVYVGAFVLASSSGLRPRLNVIAVTRTGCQPVYHLNRKLPAAP